MDGWRSRGNGVTQLSRDQILSTQTGVFATPVLILFVIRTLAPNAGGVANPTYN
jgi:hypothetical protein